MNTLPEGTWALTSPFGMRVHPITGERKMHTGTDFAAPDGTPILAAADGTVSVAEFSGGYGGLIVVEHQIAGIGGDMEDALDQAFGFGGCERRLAKQGEGFIARRARYTSTGRALKGMLKRWLNTT